jgi:hypothetical protein
MPGMIIDPKTLGPAENGDLRVQITAKDGAVFVHFGTPVAWFGVPNDQALELAKQLLRAAGAKKVKIIF